MHLLCATQPGSEVPRRAAWSCSKLSCSILAGGLPARSSSLVPALQLGNGEFGLCGPKNTFVPWLQHLQKHCMLFRHRT